MVAQTVTSIDGTLTAVQAGRGRDAVLIHSQLTDRHAFDPILPRLSQRYRVTLINLPGFEGSQPVPAVMDAYVERLHTAFDDFGIGRNALVIANGFGGTVALAFALAHSKLVGRLVVSDVAATFPDVAKQTFRLMAQKATERGMGDIAEMVAYRIFHPDYLAAHPHVIADRHAVLGRIDPVGFSAACTVLMDVDLTAKLPDLRVPTLVVCGDRDESTPPGLNRAVADSVPGARYIEIAGCGHCPPIERPDAFLSAIQDFIGLP